MVIDAIQPKIEQDLYVDDDFDSFVIADDDKKVKSNDSVIICISPPEDYIDIEKSLNTTVIKYPLVLKMKSATSKDLPHILEID